MTALAKVEMGLTVYDRVDPMEFINQMGKVFALSGAGGCQTESDGKLMALACLCERKNIFEIARRYHLMKGKLVLKAETMLGDFRRAGGGHRWVNDGSDGREAVLELTDPKGNRLLSRFTIEQAQKAGYVKSGEKGDSQWIRRPEQMLRARCITEGVRMLMPEISSGEFVEEESDDFGPTVKAATPVKVSAAKPTQVLTPTPTPTREPGDEDTVDAHAEPVTSTASSEPVPFDVPGESTPAHRQTATLMELEATIGQAGLSVPQLLGSLNAKNKTAHVRLDDLAPEAAEKLLGNLRAAIAARAEKTAAAQ